jgi:hypothetical protein
VFQFTWLPLCWFVSFLALLLNNYYFCPVFYSFESVFFFILFVISYRDLELCIQSVAYDLSSAPKDFQVSGWYQGLGDDSDKQQPTATNLGEFTYDIEKSNAQTFQLDKTTTDAQVINTVRLDFFSNHGQPDLTCIYRFRVHGSEPGSLGTTASKA